MEEMINAIANYGLSIVIVALFLYDWFTNKKSNNEILKSNHDALDVIVETNTNIKDCLKNIEQNNNNMAKSLDILQKSMENQNQKIDKLLEKSYKEGGK